MQPSITPMPLFLKLRWPHLRDGLPRREMLHPAMHTHLLGLAVLLAELGGERVQLLGECLE